MASLNSIRVFLVICCHQGFSIHQFDVDTAFLNGHLKNEVFIYPPEGVEANPKQIFRLNRSLYGLKQATATWFKTISSIFVSMRFKQSATDSCTFIREDINSQIYVTLYVDDMLIGAKSIETIRGVASELSKHFKMKILGNVRFIIGIEVDYMQYIRQMTISQGAFITRMIQRFQQAEAKPVKNSSIEGQFLVKSNKKDPRMDKRPYRSLVGSLLYVANGTRSDLPAQFVN